MNPHVFRIIVEPDRFEDGRETWHASCPVLQGCHTWGHTYEEAVANIREAIDLYGARCSRGRRDHSSGTGVTQRVMAKRIDIALHSDYSPETCIAKLTEQVDLDIPTLFSLSGYKGKKPILGKITGNEFRLHKRRYWHNSFGPVLFGRVMRDGRGTVIEAYWEVWKAVRIFMRIWLALVVLFSAPLFPSALKCAMGYKCTIYGDYWVGVIVPPSLVLFGVLLPRIGSALSFHERKQIAGLLERALVAGQTPMRDPERIWESSLDVFRFWAN